jgi:deoxyribodipyrimidine photolyase-related protein
VSSRKSLPTPGFVLSEEDFATWAAGRTRFVMEDFYRDQRRKFGVLLEADGAPEGGHWNHDHDNRQPPPKTTRLAVPAPWHPRENEIDARVRAELDAAERTGKIRPVGVDGPRQFAVGHDEANRALRRFLDHRLPSFGPHQDAMLTHDWAMAHALLSWVWHLYWHHGPDYLRRNALQAHGELPAWWRSLASWCSATTGSSAATTRPR